MTRNECHGALDAGKGLIDGQFKILQVSDLEYSNGAATPCSDVAPWGRPCTEVRTTAFLRRLLEAEKPQLVVVTGDTVVRGAADPRAALSQVLAPLVESGVPWALVLGNHDRESGLPPLELVRHVRGLDGVHGCTVEGPSHLPGAGNYNLTVYDATGRQPLLALALLDSGRGHNKHGGYDWITHRQIQWTLETAAAVDRMAAPPRRVPMLVFFHIPLPEFATLLADPEADRRLSGTFQEPVWASGVNGGLFAAAISDGHIKGIFVGHDHLNDYCHRNAASGMYLCYAGSAGYGAYSKVGWDRRARVILLDAHGSLFTWKRTDNGALAVVDEERMMLEPGPAPPDAFGVAYRYRPLSPSAERVLLVLAGAAAVLLLAWLRRFVRRPQRAVRAIAAAWPVDSNPPLERLRTEKFV